MAKISEYIEERKDSYRVHIPYNDELGIRRFYSKSFSIKKFGTKPAALKAARKHRDEIKFKLANKQIIKLKHYTLEEVFNGMMSIYTVTIATKDKVQGTYNKYIKSFIGGNRDFTSIKFDDIQKCLNNMVSTAKDDTIQRTFSIWKRMYHYAVAKDIIAKDETYNVTLPKSDIITIKKPMKTSFDELTAVLKLIDTKIENRRDSVLMQAALLIMYFTGMRPAEVMALDKRNIDLDCMSIYVCQSVGSTSTEANTIKKTKNENSIRHIPIDPRLIPVLDKLYTMSSEGLLFIRDNGELMNGNFLSSACQRLTKNQFRPYTLRHQFSTDLLTNGNDIRTIQEMMGHASSTMTIGYARSNDELKRQALLNRNKDTQIIADLS